jgi:uncharacterized protein YbbC (DUF1343 family)
MDSKIIAIIKLVCIVHLLIFLPKIIYHQDYKNPQVSAENKIMVGIENLMETDKEFKWLKKLKLALISNNINEENLEKNKKIKRLLSQGFNIKKIFVPNKNEKNSEIVLAANKSVNSIPIFRWNNTKSTLPRQYIATFDALLFDVSTSGLRYDESFLALLKTMQTADQYGKKLIVLDRPNPLGSCIEGSGEIPLRPGLTIGEMAQYLNKNYFQAPIDLTVIPMLNWKRDKPLLGLNTKKIPLNFSNFNSFYGYSFLNLLEKIKPIRVGNNSTDAFQSILLPQGEALTPWEIDYLKTICSKLGIFCKSYSFFDYKTNTQYNGIKFRIKNDISNFSAFNAMLTIGRFFKNRKNIKLSFSKNFDEILGSNTIRKFLQNSLNFEKLKEETDNSLNQFYTKAKDCLLYKPYPQIKNLELVRN